MKKRWLFIILLFVIILLGVYIQSGSLISGINSITRLKGKWTMDANVTDQPDADTEVSQEGKNKILYWVAPMDPNYRRDKPGKSPMGMDLVPVYKDDENKTGKNVVSIAPEVINNLGVRTAIVERGELSRRIDTVGYIDYDETKISHVHLRTDGWIHHLTVAAEEERVKKGELLFTLYSPTLVNAQEEFLQAAASSNKALAEASAERLLALGLTRAQIDDLRKTGKPTQYVATYAGQSGVVSDLNVRHGMYVKPETEVMSLASLDSIWIEAEVFERQANWVKAGQLTEARIPAMPGHVWKGTVDYVYPELDPVTRTLRVRLRFENPDELLKPNMYADVSILSDLSGTVIYIPKEALIDDGKTTRVILALGNGRFRAQAVTPGMESGDQVEIIEGLNEGDVVVTSAQFLIDSEASLSASFQRMEPTSEPKENKVHDHPVGTGLINEVDKKNHRVNISHVAIPELNWPAMTMDFNVANHVDLDRISLNSSVRFNLARDEDGGYFIINIVPVEQGSQHD